jgi:2-polyprenyl-3-methyl-5-hydroxy-6-metoxy-1,4-benzoquinol methylase
MSAREYYEEYWSRPQPSPLGDPLTTTRGEILRQHLSASDRRILDVGCGPGTVVGEMTAEGRDVIGLDISHRAVELAASRHPFATFRQASIEDLPWPVDAQSQDVVLAFEVIEHLLRPAALIQGAQQALRPGGHLALTTPFHGRLKNIVVSLIAFDHHFDPEGDHIRFFSDRSLRNILTNNSFEVEAIHHFGRFAPLWAGVFVWARKT